MDFPIQEEQKEEKLPAIHDNSFFLVSEDEIKFEKIEMEKPEETVCPAAPEEITGETVAEAEVEEVDPPLVAQLVSMGFDRAIVKNIAEVYSDIESALEQLLH